jgi:hypothetical protein
MRRVRVVCGDWRRVLSPVVTYKSKSCDNPITGILFDPPYPEGTYSYGEGADREVAHEVRDWCKANGDHPLLRIALCGYDEHDDLLELGWTPYRWKTVTRLTARVAKTRRGRSSGFRLIAYRNSKRACFDR